MSTPRATEIINSQGELKPGDEGYWKVWGATYTGWNGAHESDVTEFCAACGVIAGVGSEDDDACACQRGSGAAWSLTASPPRALLEMPDAKVTLQEDGNEYELGSVQFDQRDRTVFPLQGERIGT